MSIGPVQSFVPAGEVQPADAQPRAPQSRTVSTHNTLAPPIHLSREPAPTRQTQPDQSASEYQPPQDQVRVQRDTELQNELIFKYVDHSGNVIFQVPSNEALSVKRGIQQEFQQRATRSAERER